MVINVSKLSIWSQINNKKSRLIIGINNNKNIWNENMKKKKIAHLWSDPNIILRKNNKLIWERSF